MGQWIYFKFKRPASVMINADIAEGEEWFDLVDVKGKVIGKAPRNEVHGNPHLIHPVIHLHVFNKQGHLYLQKRALSKDVQPGKWDTSVGGHIAAGEDVITALRRETREELGIDLQNYQPLYHYIMRNEYESEYIYTFRMTSNGPFKINTEEIIFGKFWRMADIEKNLGKNVFTPNFEQEFALLKKTIFVTKHK